MSDFDDITKNLIHSYFQDSPLKAQENSQAMNLELKDELNQNDTLIMKLDQIREQSHLINQQLFDDEGIDEKSIDTILQ